MDRDWCKFFADIEADPLAKVGPMTIRDHIMAKDHIQDCDVCFNSTERVLAKYNAKNNQIGFNTN